ncbi:hypothetical protein C5167_048888 [Papaver somniferum]|uniref:ABC transporter domain-containing protein n=1 Tax=Papaver somniferum TaxID=3469 RepID=A0A4Y7KN92_PAPSO|nr:hypothetical protein C5167_048888 [Papaver somniferum]
MGKNKGEKAGTGKPAAKDDGKKEKLSVSAMLASMDQKEDKPRGSSSATTSKPKPKVVPKRTSYTDGIDLPPSGDELSEEEPSGSVPERSNRRADINPLEASSLDVKKREKKERLAAEVLEGEDNADANVKDITVENFSVSAQSRLLLQDTSEDSRAENIDVLLVEKEELVMRNQPLKLLFQPMKNSSNSVKKLQLCKIYFLMGDNENNGEDDGAGEKLAELYERLQVIGADAAESQASKILAGLGFTTDMQLRSTQSFSGGWRMRISLARALFVQPTLLLLDEPTNHLDLRVVLWLEEYLCRWKNTLVVVSHDRDFLNTVCNEIIHLHDQKLQLYRGNFDDFERGYDQRRKESNKKTGILDNQVKDAIRTGNPVKQNNAKERLINVNFTYPKKKDFRLSNVNIGIDMGTRVAIMGPNGAGKSTLLNLLFGDLVSTEGEARKSQKLRIGRYSQHFVDLLTMTGTPVEYLLRLHPEQEGLSKQEFVRTRLGKFGLFKGNHTTPIVQLSGGQKARVVFTSIYMSKPHILLLDEPTNHLDMQSIIDALADAFDEFTGGVVLVSHDSRLISRVCGDEEKSQIWIVDNGTVESFRGTFDEYKEDLQKEIKAEVDERSFLKYSGFRNAQNVHLDGMEDITPEGILRLTNTKTKHVVGHCFYSNPIQFNRNSSSSSSNGTITTTTTAVSFSTTFVFAVVSESEVSGQGLAFVIAPTRELPGALGNQFLGLFNVENEGKSANQVFPVDLDTSKDVEYDKDNNHVGININGLKSAEAKYARYYTVENGGYKNLLLKSGRIMQVWVAYDGSQKQLNVTIAPIQVAKPDVPLLSFSRDLSTILLGNRSMYVGFSSSTRTAQTFHYILGWSFQINGDAQDFKLSTLPKLPKGKPNILTIVLSVGISIAVLTAICTGIFFFLRKRKFAELVEDWEQIYGTHRFTYKDLYMATNGFAEKEIIGSGAFDMADRPRVSYQTPPPSPCRSPPHRDHDVSLPGGGSSKSSQGDARVLRVSSSSGQRHLSSKRGESHRGNTQKGDRPKEAPGSRYVVYRPLVNPCDDPKRTRDVLPLRSVAPPSASHQHPLPPPPVSQPKGRSSKEVVSKTDVSKVHPKRKASERNPSKGSAPDPVEEEDISQEIRSVAAGEKKVTFKHIDLEVFKEKHGLQLFDVRFYAADDDITYEMISTYRFDEFHLLTTVGAFEASLMLPLYKSGDSF